MIFRSRAGSLRHPSQDGHVDNTTTELRLGCKISTVIIIRLQDCLELLMGRIRSIGSA